MDKQNCVKEIPRPEGFLVQILNSSHEKQKNDWFTGVRNRQTEHMSTAGTPEKRSDLATKHTINTNTKQHAWSFHPSLAVMDESFQHHQKQTGSPQATKNTPPLSGAKTTPCLRNAVICPPITQNRQSTPNNMHGHSVHHQQGWMDHPNII